MHAPFRLLGQRPCPEYGSPRHSQVSTFTQDRRKVFLQPTEAPSVFTLFVQYGMTVRYAAPQNALWGRSRAEIQTRDGRARGSDTDHKTMTPP